MRLNDNDILCESLRPEIYEDEFEKKMFRVICYNKDMQSFEYLTGPCFDSLKYTSDCEIYYDMHADQYYATVQDELRYCVKHENLEDLYKIGYKVCPAFCIDVRVGLYVKINFEPIELQRYGYEKACVYNVEQQTVYEDGIIYRDGRCGLLINDTSFNVNKISSCEVHLNNDNPNIAVMSIRCGKMTPSAIVMLRKSE